MIADDDDDDDDDEGTVIRRDTVCILTADTSQEGFIFFVFISFSHSYPLGMGMQQPGKVRLVWSFGTSDIYL